MPTLIELSETRQQCEVRVCGRDRCGSLYCKKHDARARRHGDPQMGARGCGLGIAWLHRFALVEASECIIWPFSKTQGYGRIRVSGRDRQAHIVAYELFHVCEFPPGKIARHLCGNGHLGCVNPQHIVPGTQIENMNDRTIHGRTCEGDRHGRSVLTESQVSEICVRLEAGEQGLLLAKEFGVSPSAISLIRRGKTWKCVALKTGDSK